MRISVVFVVSRAPSVSLLYLWSLCHLELTRLQSEEGSCDTNHSPAFILLYQPHPLSLPLFLSVFFFPVTHTPHCHSLFCLLLPTLACSFFLYPSSLAVLFSLSVSELSPPNCSLIRFGKPLASPFNPLPLSSSTAEYPLEHYQKNKKKCH